MDHRLLEIIACPVCNGKLYYSQDKQELICKLDSLAFPLRDGIPVLLETEARPLALEESHHEFRGHYSCAFRLHAPAGKTTAGH